MLHLVVASSSTFLAVGGSHHTVPRAAARMQFSMPKLPNPFGGNEDEQSPSAPPTVGGFVAPPRAERPEFKLELPALPNPFAQELKLSPLDVRFTDVDGDVVTLRPNGGSAVDFYVGNDLRLEKARMVENGGTLEITGKVKKSTPLSMIGFNLEEITTEGVTPRDPADVERAMALVPY